jgi:pimeloyl-ACP methyl ester carboxylesterase
VQIQNDDVTLDIAIDGADDAPPVVLLHGITSSSRTWDFLVPRLTDSWRVIRLDFRGHGGSDRAPGAYGADGYLADAVAVCEQIAGHACPMIGHSLGGVTAAALAQQRPDLVTRVLLEDAPLSMPQPESADADSTRENALLDGFRFMRRTIPAVQSSGVSPEQLARIMMAAPTARGGTFGEIMHDDAMLTMAIGMLRVDASVLDPVLDGTIGREFDPDAPIEVPVTAVAADPAMPDAATRPGDLEQLMATSPRAEAVTVDGAGHLIHDSKAGREEFWRLVEQFLTQT